MSKKVLVIDDGEEILEGIKIVLEDEGYEVDLLTNSMKVVDRVKKTKPHLVLIDYMMPGIDGAKVTEKLKSEASLKKIPVIMFSASQELEKVAMSAGADGILAKPFEIDTLIEKIKYYLD